MREMPFAPLVGRFWRMLHVAHQNDPLSGEGARIHGGRWNARGTPALYLAQDHGTAIAEFYQDYVMPGTLVACDVEAEHIADLTDGRGGAADPEVVAALSANWARIADVERGTPPSWTLTERLIAAGAQGALAPSAQQRGGTNLVLWRWGDAGGAEVRLIDPEGALTGR